MVDRDEVVIIVIVVGVRGCYRCSVIVFHRDGDELFVVTTYPPAAILPLFCPTWSDSYRRMVCRSRCRWCRSCRSWCSAQIPGAVPVLDVYCSDGIDVI